MKWLHEFQELLKKENIILPVELVSNHLYYYLLSWPTKDTLRFVYSGGFSTSGL